MALTRSTRGSQTSISELLAVTEVSMQDDLNAILRPKRPKRIEGQAPEATFLWGPLMKSAYKVLTWISESKKPRLMTGAKCLIFFVANRGIEPRTRGFSIPDLCYLLTLSAIAGKLRITTNQLVKCVANNPHVEKC